MALHRLRRLTRAARTRLIYRLDALLGMPPIVQVLGIVALTAMVVLAWAIALRLARPVDPDARDLASALWWSVTRFADGGTMAADPLHRRLLAIGATFSGILVLSLLTAAFASKMAERIGDLRSGLNPVVERDHVLILGYDPKVALIAREFGRSGQRLTLVVLAVEPKEKIEAALRPALRAPRHRLRLVVRTGDPRADTALARVSAARARSVIVVPPAALDDEAALRWTLSTLLALRRAAEETFHGQVIVEARHAEARELLLLAGAPGIAGQGALATEVVASDDVVARVLAQSARQDGVYFVLRHILEFDECDIYLDPVPEALVGRAFEEAHAAVRGAVLLGVRAAGQLLLCPARGAAPPLARGDQLVVLARGARRYTFDGTLPPARIEPASSAPGGATGASGGGGDDAVPSRVVLLGFNRTVAHLVREFDAILAPGSTLRVVTGADNAYAAAQIDGLRAGLSRLAVECDARSPVALARAGDADVLGADAVVILGCEDETDDNGDARALATLLWLRHGARKAGRRTGRVVTEVRDPRSAAHVATLAHDFVVSTDVVAMLLAQEALEPDVAPVYRELLSPEGAEIFVRPRARYAPDGDEAATATFADVMAAACARGEVALGYFVDVHEGTAADDADDADDAAVCRHGALTIYLNPPRDARVPPGRATQIVVLARAH